MESNAIVIATTSFLACAVEMVEALSIVVAVGVTRGWARALGAAACAVVVLAIAVAIAGPRLPELAENPWVKLAVGLVALYVGSKWLYKAVLRAAGRKALRDENAAYARGLARAEKESPGEAFATAFTGVLTEGIEVVAIVLALGSGSPATLAGAAGGAFVALVLVAALGIAVKGPLSRVPENTLKYIVGVMLTAFGLYWVGEGVQVRWPASDVALFYLAALVLAVALASTAALRRTPAAG
jgi:uncharacterized membrane protein